MQNQKKMFFSFLNAGLFVSEKKTWQRAKKIKILTSHSHFIDSKCVVGRLLTRSKEMAFDESTNCLSLGCFMCVSVRCVCAKNKKYIFHFLCFSIFLPPGIGNIR